MLHHLCGSPSIPLSFILAYVLPRRITYRVSLGAEVRPPTPSNHRLHHMLHHLCGSPSIPLSFILAYVLPRRITYRVSLGAEVRPPTPSNHRLQRGLPGYLILFATHAFALQRQYLSSGLTSPSAFLQISTNFTSTLVVPPTSPPGYLILFATHAFALQRQYLSSGLTSPSAFLQISTNFTSTLVVPPTSPIL